MRLLQQFQTKNDCYKAGKTIAVKGVMVHSTGANNPRVSRYVRGNAEMGRNTGGNHWDMSNAEAKKKFGQKLNKCVHAFIGLFADDKIGTVQTLPWTTRAWHCGGLANDSHIGIEICEDGLKDSAYFQAVYREAVELTAMLCKQYGLDPLKDGVVLCHCEGRDAGIASNHADVLHWWPKHGKSMHDFRLAVKREMEGDEDMSYEQFKDYMARYEAEKAKEPASAWAESILAKARAKGITDGTRPQNYASRQEVAAMVLKLTK